MQEESDLWGGRPPTEELRGWGWRAARLARDDRDLVDRLVALSPGQQRAVATWAATRACERAGILDVPAAVEALDLVARSGRLPALWKDWDAVWDALFPPDEGDEPTQVVVTLHTATTVSLGGGPPPRTPLGPEASAIEAVQGAGKKHPGKAAARAVAGLSHGAEDLPACFAEVRDEIRRVVGEP
ncbi:hypothetical protein [Cellulomonas sp. URHB0016]